MSLSVAHRAHRTAADENDAASDSSPRQERRLTTPEFLISVAKKLKGKPDDLVCAVVSKVIERDLLDGIALAKQVHMSGDKLFEILTSAVVLHAHPRFHVHFSEALRPFTLEQPTGRLSRFIDRADFNSTDRLAKSRSASEHPDASRYYERIDWHYAELLKTKQFEPSTDLGRLPIEQERACALIAEIHRAYTDTSIPSLVFTEVAWKYLAGSSRLQTAIARRWDEGAETWDARSKEGYFSRIQDLGLSADLAGYLSERRAVINRMLPAALALSDEKLELPRANACAKALGLLDHEPFEREVMSRLQSARGLDPFLFREKLRCTLDNLSSLLENTLAKRGYRDASVTTDLAAKDAFVDFGHRSAIPKPLSVDPSKTQRKFVGGWGTRSLHVFDGVLWYANSTTVQAVRWDGTKVYGPDSLNRRAGELSNFYRCGSQVLAQVSSRKKGDNGPLFWLIEMPTAANASSDKPKLLWDGYSPGFRNLDEKTALFLSRPPGSKGHFELHLAGEVKLQDPAPPTLPPSTCGACVFQGQVAYVTRVESAQGPVGFLSLPGSTPTTGVGFAHGFFHAEVGRCEVLAEGPSIFISWSRTHPDGGESKELWRFDSKSLELAPVELPDDFVLRAIQRHGNRIVFLGVTPDRGPYAASNYFLTPDGRRLFGEAARIGGHVEGSGDILVLRASLSKSENSHGCLFFDECGNKIWGNDGYISELAGIDDEAVHFTFMADGRDQSYDWVRVPRVAPPAELPDKVLSPVEERMLLLLRTLCDPTSENVSSVVQSWKFDHFEPDPHLERSAVTAKAMTEVIRQEPICFVDSVKAEPYRMTAKQLVKLAREYFPGEIPPEQPEEKPPRRDYNSKSVFRSSDVCNLMGGDPNETNSKVALRVSGGFTGFVPQASFFGYDGIFFRPTLVRSTITPDLNTASHDVQIPMAFEPGSLTLPAFHGAHVEKVAEMRSFALFKRPAKPLDGFSEAASAELRLEKSVKGLTYRMRFHGGQREIPELTERQYEAFLAPLIGEAKPIGVQLSEFDKDTRGFLASLLPLPPRERMLQVLRYVRENSFYDKKEPHKEREARASMDPLRRIQSMQDRARATGTIKIFAGVCADFAFVTAAMCEAVNVRVGIDTGLMVKNGVATVVDKHAIAWAPWPDTRSGIQIIELDGTPSGAVDGQGQEIPPVNLEGIELPQIVPPQQEESEQDDVSPLGTLPRRDLDYCDSRPENLLAPFDYLSSALMLPGVSERFEAGDESWREALKLWTANRHEFAGDFDQESLQYSFKVMKGCVERSFRSWTSDQRKTFVREVLTEVKGMFSVAAQAEVQAMIASLGKE